MKRCLTVVSRLCRRNIHTHTQIVMHKPIHADMHKLCTQVPSHAEKGVAPNESSAGWHMVTVMVPA